MDYTLGNTQSKDFQEFLIDDNQSGKDGSNRNQNRQRQPKLSNITTKVKRSTHDQNNNNQVITRDMAQRNGAGGLTR